MATLLAVLIFFFYLLTLPFADSSYFQRTRFDQDDSDMVYQGDASATRKVGTIDFNLVNYVNRVGWASYANKVRLWDSDSGKRSDFSTRFSFVIDAQDVSKYGHGIAFFLAPVGFQIPPNSAGGFLGLFNTTTNNLAQNQIVHVEFDTFWNEGWDPESASQSGHVGINNNSVASAVSVPWNASLHMGDTAEAQIAYNATTMNLSVSWSYSRTSKAQESSSLSHQIDLMEVLPEHVMVGFSAATGSSPNIENHVLKSWEFSSSLEDKTNHRLSPKLVTGISVSGGLIFIAGVVTMFLIIRRRRQRRNEAEERMNLTSMSEDLERGAGPRMFLRKDLAFATNNFSDKRKLGEGGFGAVYKGYLVSLDLPVAVKKISRTSRQGKKEYTTEVKVITMLRHRNLVQLLGWCHEKGEFLLVYEFMPNGSLDAHLFGTKKPPLTWDSRHKIALGLASGLLYLHEESEQCVVHRDVKASNVMLDSSFNAKLGDFGLARLVDHGLGPQTTGVAGTFGYLAPEYVSTGRASKEADVYSFGIVVLEIGTGRKCSDPVEGGSEMGLAEWVWDLYGRGDLVSARDSGLSGGSLVNWESKQVECLLMVGLWCAHPDRGLRPSVRQAIQVLNFEASVPELPSKMPVPVYYIPTVPSCATSGQVFETDSSFGVGR